MSTPHFRFYADRFLRETERLAKPDRAAYAMLLVHMHALGVDRIDATAAKRLLGLREGAWRGLVRALVLIGRAEVDAEGRLAAPEVGRELGAAARVRAARRKAGRASGAARRKRMAEPGTNHEYSVGEAP